MAAIRAKNTTPELIVRRGLHSRGLRFRLHAKALPGTPDLIFASRRTVVFVHGCFWHAHAGCRYYKVPQTRTSHWVAKLEGNRERDARDRAALEAQGWRVLVVWECELRGRKADEVAASLDTLANTIRS
jgi:DNA mismatch endonuclease (patch repair protein)